MSNPSESTPQSPHWLLRRADQAAVAFLVVLGLASTVGWWIFHGGLRGELIEVEHAPPQTARFQVDVNSAAWPELVQIPGVGRTLADRIVESRQREGPFVEVEDLRRVHGIGRKTLDSMRPFLRPLPKHSAIAGSP
jgi:competence protein ComEA